MSMDQKMNALAVMLKPASGSCNMSCNYCFYCDEMRSRSRHSYGRMSEETLKNVIRKTMPQARCHISYAYQGGEPTLRGLDFFKKAVAYQKQYNHNRIRITNALQTNGYALDEEWCRFFRENDFLIGISVDGTRQLHDAMRHDGANGQGTYDRVLKSIRMLEQFGVDYNILTVVTEQTAQYIEEVYAAYRANGWHYQQYIECLDPIADGFGSREYSLRPETFGRFLIRLFDLWYEDWKLGKQPYIRKFDNYIGILMGQPPEACEQQGQCGIQVVVEADGSAYPCDFYMMDPDCLGNFNTDRLPALNQRRQELGFVERSRKITAACKACPYHFLCRGGCQRTRRYDSREDAYQSWFCKGYRMFFEHSLPMLREVAAAGMVYKG